MKCGLLGRKLGHSYSPQIHALMADYSYDLFEKEPEQVGDFVRNGDYTAMNVTIPYKKDVIPFLDYVDEKATRLGSVNTIVRKGERLEGHNTDYYGFHSLVLRSGIQVEGEKVLVLGTGGTSVTAQAVLQDLGAQVVVISRSGENNYDNLSLHYDASVIVNTTPVGMYPNVGVAPLDIRQFPKLAGVLDVIYNPSKTQLLLDAEALGLPHENGLWMLVAQAKQACEFFTDTQLDDSIIASIHTKLRAQMENIVLIGMPGSGKSSVGQALAEATGKTFVDADEEVVKLAGMSIPDLFASHGEEVFRAYETKALAELCKRSGLIVATGGGCVTRERNYPHLHQNSTIFWLRRDIGLLPTNGRPLSQTQKLTDMFEIRKPMYERFADHAIDNDGTIDETAGKILEVLQ